MDARELFEKGIQSFGTGQYVEALEHLERISHQDTDPEGIYVDLAGSFISECYKCHAIKCISLGEEKEALKVLEKGLQRVSGHREMEFYRGVAYNNIMNFPMAIRILEGLLGGDPGNMALVTCLSTTLLNLGNIDRVEQLAGKALRLNPDMMLRLAVARFRLKKYTEAEDLLSRAISGKSPFEEAETMRLAVLLILKRHDEAMRQAEALLPQVKEKKSLGLPLAYLRNRIGTPSSDPGVREVLGSYADLQPGESEIKRWADNLFHHTLSIDVMAVPFQAQRSELLKNDWFRGLLVQHYQKMIVQGVDLPDLYFRLGREFQRINQHREAAEYLQKCLEKAPHFLPAKISLAFAYLEQGADDDASGCFEEIRQDFRNMPGLLMRSGDSAFDENAYKGKENHLRAELQVLLAAAKDSPGYADIYYSIGRIHFLLEDPENALSYFDRASLINPNFIRANIAKAVTLMQLNRTEQAREILDGLSGNSELLGKILFFYGQLMLRKGNQAKAAELLREAAGMENEYAVRARELLAQSGLS